MLKVLLDPSVRRNAVTHRTVLEPQTIQWGDITQTLEIAKRRAFPPRPDEKFRIEQIPYIAALHEMVRNRQIRLYKSPEIRMEDIRNRFPDRGYLGLDLLEGVHLELAKSPFERTIVFSGFGDHVGVTKGEQLAFFRSIDAERFVELRMLINDAHLGDMFHFWTAEMNELDIYLVMDNRFLNPFRHSVEPKISTATSILTPRELCEKLNVQPADLEKIENENPPFA